jgi:methyltransferase (TIGR00027 family)
MYGPRMLDERTRANISSTAHLTAGMRTLGRLTDGEAANADYLADRFLLLDQRSWTWAPRLSRYLFDRFVPGAFGYFNARTRYFDDVLLQAAANGLDQLVVLGAGFDSRSLRFASQLGAAQVFEVDRPEVLKTRAERLRDVAHNARAVAVPIDFERDDLADVLRSHGFVARGVRSLFLWEGVTYYLTESAVDTVLARVAALTEAPSGIVFDYVTRAFFEGDVRAYGAKQLSLGWKSMGNVNRSGVADVHSLLAPHGFRVLEQLDPAALEQRYLHALPGGPRKVWGVMRIAHAQRS